MSDPLAEFPDGTDREALTREILDGLDGSPPTLPTRLLYDRRGSELFEAITQLEAYYPTRTELAILQEVIPDWVRRFQPRALVELGAGSARKTRVILDALTSGEDEEVFVPVDLSGAFLDGAARDLRKDYPELRIIPQVADFTEPLNLDVDLPAPTWLALLGSTLGNFTRPRAGALLRQFREVMSGEDFLLLGVDLKPGPWKPRERLERAYDDPEGITAEFNRNILRVVNRIAGLDFDPDSVDHWAPWVPEEGRMEMRLVFREAREVRTADGSRAWAFAPGEWIRTEISCKYDEAEVRSILGSAGLRVEEWAQDPQGRFALVLAGLDR